MITTLALLWLPILLSAVFVFVISSIVHMVIPIHAGDYKKMPAEESARKALRDAQIPPGQYMFPNADSMKEVGTPEMQAKFEEGPVGILVMRGNGMPNMGSSLLQWFVLCVVISTIVAHLAGIGLAPGAAGGKVFHVTALTALLGHAFTTVNDSIWKGISWSVTGKFIFDGLLYALATGATFAWLWPAAA